MIKQKTLVRRWALALVLAVGATFVATDSWAGSYLDRAALLVAHANQESAYLRARLSDDELAKMLHKMAVARVGAAKTMNVPKEVAQAHPHLLLMLENHERAAEAAVDGSSQRFLVYQRRARHEESIFRGILKQLGWPLPKLE